MLVRLAVEDMATAVRMPLMGMTMEEGVVSEWLVPDGAEVSKGQEILEFETDKINARVEAPADGVLGGVVAVAGDAVPVQGLLAWILESGEDPPAEDPDPPGGSKSSATSVAVVADKDESGSSETSTARLEPRAPEPQVPIANASVSDPDVRIKVSPLAKRVARELGVDLGRVVGTGPGGRIIEKDVMGASQAPSVVAAPAMPVITPSVTPDLPAGSTVPISGVRRVIADRMQQSLQQSAQVTLVAEADARRFHDLRTELAARHEPVKISYNVILIRICAQALREHTRANASIEGDVIRLHDVVNIGLAMEAGSDLVVANVKHADQKSLVEIASDLHALISRARNDGLSLDDITGGTFTITNLGLYGIDAFTPVLNPPESAILGVGALREKAVVRDGDVVAQLSMTLSLTFDHRVIDGKPAARFLSRIRELIEQPYLLL